MINCLLCLIFKHPKSLVFFNITILMRIVSLSRSNGSEAGILSCYDLFDTLVYLNLIVCIIQIFMVWFVQV